MCLVQKRNRFSGRLVGIVLLISLLPLLYVGKWVVPMRPSGDKHRSNPEW